MSRLCADIDERVNAFLQRPLAVARSTVQETLKRAARAGLSWPLPESMNDTLLEQRLFAGAATQLGARRRPEPDWARLALELKRPGVTLTVLWDEYRAVHPDGYAYSRFEAPCTWKTRFARPAMPAPLAIPTKRWNHAKAPKARDLWKRQSGLIVRFA